MSRPAHIFFHLSCICNFLTKGFHRLSNGWWCTPVTSLAVSADCFFRHISGQSTTYYKMPGKLWIEERHISKFSMISEPFRNISFEFFWCGEWLFENWNLRSPLPPSKASWGWTEAHCRIWKELAEHFLTAFLAPDEIANKGIAIDNWRLCPFP